MNAAAIKALRQRLSLTQYALSNLLGVRRETVVRWENDLARPHPGHRQRLQELAMAEAEKLAKAYENGTGREVLR